jgi:hypothetical protein
MLRRVVLVRTDVSEELGTSIIRVTKISELGKTLPVTSIQFTANVVPSSPILVTLMMMTLDSSSVHIGATRRNIQEDGILYTHRRGNLKSYTKILNVLNHKFLNIFR